MERFANAGRNGHFQHAHFIVFEEHLVMLGRRDKGVVLRCPPLIEVSGTLSEQESGAKRAIRLPVSGAFHSPLMEPAVVGLTSAIATSAFIDPSFPVYSNVTADANTTAAGAKDLLLRQLTSPVKWSTEIRNIAKRFPDALYVEMGPGNVLSGLMGRLVKGARTFACGTAAETDKLLQTGA
jgi:[acyl-carrier-protein] S-malonyltransferase